ncbi:MAG: alpha-amylase [Muribaculaceae bacterium]|nr:alpha-amylase [Muribaculaceae bacterium]
MKKLFASLAVVCASLFGFAQNPAPTAVTHPEWSRNAVIYEVNVRQATPEGTFEAFLPQIQRLKDLGVDILWFMPIHPISEDGRKGTLGSYYAVRDYKGVNPEFGNIDDFRKVVKAAHDAGMKVIIDWVPNHSGRDNAWVKNHPDWYQRNEKGEMFGPYDWTDVYKFDYTNPQMRAAMTDAMAYWLREADIDGFRCDVAFEVPLDFWNENRPQLEKVKSPIFMLAEAPNPELMEQGFDMDYNWPMKDLFSAIAATAGQYSFKDAQGNIKSFPETHAADIYTRLDEEATKYPGDSYLMNMITNHDLNSWEGTEFERLGNLSQAFAVLSYTLPGMPLIYTGQEVGLDRAFEFFEKDQAPDWNANQDITAFYKALNELKHTQPALAAGSARGAKIEKIATASPDIIAFRRGNVMVVANLGKDTVKPFKKAPSVNGMTDWFTKSPASLPKTLAPGQYLLFVGE